MRRNIILLCTLMLLAGIFLTSCAVKYKTVFDARVVPTKKQDKVYDTVTALLMERGFDIKLANKDIGAITTEYKKYGAIGGSPPFDLYLQIRVKITQVADKVEIILTPMDKEVNRVNAAAFTENPMIFFEDTKEKSVGPQMVRARLPGFLLFTNVVQDVATALGTPIEQIKFNTEDNEVVVGLEKLL